MGICASTIPTLDDDGFSSDDDVSLQSIVANNEKAQNCLNSYIDKPDVEDVEEYLKYLNEVFEDELVDQFGDELEKIQ